MTLSNAQIKKLLEMVAETQDDCIDCDKCLEHIAFYAETHLQGLTLCETLTTVKVHLESCKCCQHEFEFFLEALRTLNEE